MTAPDDDATQPLPDPEPDPDYDPNQVLVGDEPDGPGDESERPDDH
jgi:hypothetical protein